MSPRSSQTPRRMAILGFLVGLVVTVCIGVFGFGDPLLQVIPRGVGMGVGIAAAFYLVDPTSGDSETAE